ncbi:MAG: radical SAM protein [Peptostreptococcaceae bacterium]|nr:radical SAM protein [Peptostreptococcaceae bacterium]
MIYEGVVYRPPSEARSLIIQATIGCSHNKCKFCTMYKGKKFRMKKRQEIVDDLIEMHNYYKDVKRIFLADGDALIMKMDDLKYILTKINELYENVERIGIYASPRSIMTKSVQELKELKSLNLKIAYLGVESGDDEVLELMNKGVNSDEMLKAALRIKESGIKLSTMILSGLGGKDLYKNHAINSAKLISKIKPDYLSLLTLLVEESSDLNKMIEEDEFKLLNPKEVLDETKIFIDNLELEKTLFRSNHASNYVNLEGVLNEDKSRLLEEISIALRENFYKEELFRRL